MEKKLTNKNAIYSLIFSAVSFFIFWVLAPCGIGLGIRALMDIKKTGEKGKVLAILGMILGVISMTLYFATRIMNK